MLFVHVLKGFFVENTLFLGGRNGSEQTRGYDCGLDQRQSVVACIGDVMKLLKSVQRLDHFRR